MVKTACPYLSSFGLGRDPNTRREHSPVDLARSQSDNRLVTVLVKCRYCKNGLNWKEPTYKSLSGPYEQLLAVKLLLQGDFTVKSTLNLIVSRENSFGPIFTNKISNKILKYLEDVKERITQISRFLEKLFNLILLGGQPTFACQ